MTERLSAKAPKDLFDDAYSKVSKLADMYNDVPDSIPDICKHLFTAGLSVASSYAHFAVNSIQNKKPFIPVNDFTLNGEQEKLHDANDNFSNQLLRTQNAVKIRKLKASFSEMKKNVEYENMMKKLLNAQRKNTEAYKVIQEGLKDILNRFTDGENNFFFLASDLPAIEKVCADCGFAEIREDFILSDDFKETCKYISGTKLEYLKKDIPTFISEAQKAVDSERDNQYKYLTMLTKELSAGFNQHQ